MRGGLQAIQQTLTVEAATVLTHSIAEAGRRNHGQTTPLHVAATLLASPTGFLRQACIRSHPNSSHPLQCRALELCFSVALERLPTAHQQNPTGNGLGDSVLEPPISNALMAALKRAQAHQRRGCPEQQQQPLLAVKVELEQLIVSILDDPSVSRVMREASFSSPAVKAAIEQALNSQTNSGLSGNKIGLGFHPGPKPMMGTMLGSGAGAVGGGGRNLYLNPWLHQQQSQSQSRNQNHHQLNGGLVTGLGRVEEVKKVLDILSRMKKRNPVLVGESEPKEVVKEVLSRIEKNEISDRILEGVEVISAERELGWDPRQSPEKLKELVELMDRKIVVNCKGGSGVIIDLGDLKWLVDEPTNQGVSEAARGVVTDIGQMLRKYGEGSRIWLIGTATCETYLRCQVYHPTMENEWDLQVVSIVGRPSMPGMLHRPINGGGILSTSVECLSPMKGFQTPLTRRVPENLDPLRRFSCCPECAEKYGQELAKVEADSAEISSVEVKSSATRLSLPPWLQNAKLQADGNDKRATDLIQTKNQDLVLRQKTPELQRKWSQTCVQLHPCFHHNVGSETLTPSTLRMTGLCNPALRNQGILGLQPFQSKQPRSLGDTLKLNITSRAVNLLDSECPNSSPERHVRTDLALGPIRPVEETVHQNLLKDFLSCIPSEPQTRINETQRAGKPVIYEDVDSFKRLLKGIIEKVWWQTDAASAVASTITQCKLGNGKRRVAGSKGDIWLLFSGPDRTGKKKMAAAISELVCGVSPILISLGSRHDGDETDLNFRGKTAMDRITDAVSRNPNSVIILQDIDEANMLIRGNIRRAMERGRLTDSHGREISLGNVIFIATSTWMPHQLKEMSNGDLALNEEKLRSRASGGWQLRISIGERATGKRSPSWLSADQERSTKLRKDLGLGLTFDLNQLADIDNDDDRLDGSRNSSDLTVEHEEEHGHETRGPTSTSSEPPNEILSSVDEAINFKPVDFASIRNSIERSILAKFSTLVGDKLSVKIEGEALEKILSGIWLGQTSLESWADKVLVPSIHRLKSKLPSLYASSPEREMVARLELDQESENRSCGDWLPSRISVVVDPQ